MADWNAQVYARVSEPQFVWGQRVLARLPLAGDEVVVDEGCGTGRLTEVIAERLPTGRVVAVDASEAMLAQARKHLARFGGRITFTKADAATYVHEPAADAVFSSATYHWVPDHDRLFASIHASLRRDGLLVSQFGGGANLGRLRGRTAALRASARFERFFEGFREPWHYATAEETRERLERAGFVQVSTWLEPAPVRFDDEASYREFVTHVILRDELTRLPDEATREAYVGALIDQAKSDDPPFEIDYWRLNADARRA